jgi:conjugative transfer signal peptidase TraF
MRRGLLGKAVRGVAIAFCGLTVVFQVFGLAGLRINTSPSLPLGIYIAASGESELVEFCPPEPWARMAAERGYRTEGTCRDGASPLLKPVVAHPGDTVEYSPAGIRINSKLLANTAPRRADSKGRVLSPWPFGTYVVAPGTIWVASSYSDRSFDSRYMGPIPVRSVRDCLSPLLTLW